MWVKICGIQTMKAALAAAEARADAVGFIFAKTRRQVTPDRVQSLVMGLPEGLDKVGVFVDESPEAMRRIAEYAGLTVVQMHGAEPPEAIDLVGRPVVKAFRIATAADLEHLPDYRAAAGLLLEPYVPGQPGGTGHALDWSLLREAEAVLTRAGIALSGPNDPLTPGKPKLILAGGLSPETVAAAIAQARPGGVDVSSGVEVDGQKDLSRIYDFIVTAKEARP